MEFDEFDKAAFEGKTIVSATYKYEAGTNDELIIEFSDGTRVTVRSISCNDDTGALNFYPR